MLVEGFVLTRPLIVFDLETTGVSKKEDRIVQIGMIRVAIDGTEKEGIQLVNPGIPIPPGATKVHGISDEDVAGQPTFAELAPKLARGLNGSDVAGYNIDGFDIDILKNEFKRAGIEVQFGKVMDSFRIFQRMKPKTLTAAVEEYLGEKMEGAHDALVDARYSLRVLRAQLLAHPELPRSVDEMHKLFFETPKDENCVDSRGKVIWVNDAACLSFGKWKGVPLSNVNKGYLQWMLDGDFPDDTKRIVSEALNGIYPKRG